jgi:Methyltransferase domain
MSPATEPIQTGARYDRIGRTYGRYRKPDARIEAQIAAALGTARTIVGVGSGTGSYEPRGRRVVAVEPSVTMIAQRPPAAAPVVRAVAERLPFRDGAFDVALALLTIHHWQDVGLGFDELERVAPVQVFFTWDPDVYRQHWLFTEYLPEITEAERDLPAMEEICRRFPRYEVQTIPIPWDCTDGFCTAYWRRPEMYLDPGARAAISPFAQLDEKIAESAMDRLRSDLSDGTWDRRHGRLRSMDSFDCGCRLVITRC